MIITFSWRETALSGCPSIYCSSSVYVKTFAFVGTYTFFMLSLQLFSTAQIESGTLHFLTRHIFFSMDNHEVQVVGAYPDSLREEQ